MVRLVLDRFDREIREPNGVECLIYWAVANGRLSLVLKCLGKIPALTSWSRLGFNWLHLAAKYGHQELVKAFVDCGIDVVAVAGRGMTVLHLAAQKGHNAAVHSILGHLRKREPVLPKQLEMQRRSHQVRSAPVGLAAVQSTMQANDDGNSPITLAGRAAHRETCHILWAEIEKFALSIHTFVEYLPAGPDCMLELAAKFERPGNEKFS